MEIERDIKQVQSEEDAGEGRAEATGLGRGASKQGSVVLRMQPDIAGPPRKLAALRADAFAWELAHQHAFPDFMAASAGIRCCRPQRPWAAKERGNVWMGLDPTALAAFTF